MNLKNWIAASVAIAAGWIGGPAMAADLGPDGAPLGLSALSPLDEAKGKIEEKQEAKDSEAEARQKALDAARSAKAARVVVLKWKGTNVDYENATVQRNVRTRIARPDAKFYPSIDLYQVGRREPRDLPASEERSSVTADNVQTVNYAIEDIQAVPWNALTESDWGITAHNLRNLADQEIWFVDRPDLREPLFKLYAQIGRAAENQNNTVPPFYDQIGGQAVNYYWYLAGALAHEDPALLSLVTNADISESIKYYKEMLDSKQIAKMTLAFEMEDKWDAEKFAGEFQVFINGLEVLVSDPESLHQVAPGRVDVYLKRSDGHSLSDRIEISKLKDKIYFVRDVARKRMGLDLIDQLMEHPNECTPEIDGESIHYITIYAKLHPEAEIYVAVPEAGNPNKIMLWRYDRVTSSLQKVLDDIGGFPVHFVALGTIGAAFNGADVTWDPETDEEYQQCLIENPTDPSACAPTPPEPELSAAALPMSAMLRLHYGRAFVPLGVEISPSLSEGPWSDRHQVRGEGTVTAPDGSELMKELPINRGFYTGLGVVLFKDAALGIGPRGWIKTGWLNVPHVLDISAHAGITAEPPGKERTGRTRLVVDVEGYAGALVPFGDTVYEKAMPNFGIAAGGGVTF